MKSKKSEPKKVSKETEKGEKSISEREIVQENLEGDVAITASEESKIFDIFSTEGFSLKIDQDAYPKIKGRAEDLLSDQKHTPPEVDMWKEAIVLNKIRATPFKKHAHKDFQKLSEGMADVLFKDAETPEGISERSETIDYIEWNSPKYTIRVKKSIWEKKKAKWIQMCSKRPKTNPTKWQNRAKEELVDFVATRMKLKKNTFSSEGEYQAYLRKFTELMLKDIPQLDEAQRKLEMV